MLSSAGWSDHLLLISALDVLVMCCEILCWLLAVNIKPHFSKQSVLSMSSAIGVVVPFVSACSTATSSGPEKPLHDPGARCCDQDVDCALVSQQETCCSNLLSLNIVE